MAYLRHTVWGWIYLPTTKNGFLSVCAKVSAVDTMRISFCRILLYEHTSTLQLCWQLINQSGLVLAVSKENYLSCSSFHVALMSQIWIEWRGVVVQLLWLTQSCHSHQTQHPIDIRSATQCRWHWPRTHACMCKKLAKVPRGSGDHHLAHTCLVEVISHEHQFLT